jgi:hypothetical protein
MPFDGSCQIRRALINGNGQAQLDLKADNGAFDWSWFLSTQPNANATLAAALTAIAANKSCYATINDPVKSFSTLVNFGIVK